MHAKKTSCEVFVTGLLAQNAFANADSVRGHFDRFVVVDPFQRFFQRKLTRRSQANRIIGTRRAHVGYVFFLARVDVHIGIASVFADDLAFVHGFIRSEEKRTAFFDITQTVRGGFARFDSDQRAARPHRNLSFERSVPVEYVVHNTAHSC